MKIEKFEDLECWREARLLVKIVYTAVNQNKKLQQDYRLRDQITNAVISVMSNIAEGFSRQSNKEFKQFLYISKASSSEVQSLFCIALDLGYIEQETFSRVYNQADKVAQIDSGMIRYLDNSARNNAKH